MPVLLHELFHGAVRPLVGDETWTGLMAELAQIFRHAERSSGRARELFDQARQRVEAADKGGAPLTVDLAVEELGAYAIELAEQAPRTWRQWADRALGHIKAWLLRRFGRQFGRVTPDQLRALSVAALKADARAQRTGTDGPSTLHGMAMASVKGDDKSWVGQRPGLFNLAPIQPVELTGLELGDSLNKKQLAKAADTLLREIQHSGVPLRNADTGWELAVSKENRKKMGYNPDLTAADSKAVAGLRELVTRAVLAESHPDEKYQNESVQAVRRLYAPALIDGKTYRIKLTVKDYSDALGKRNLHAIEAVEIENAPMGTVPTTDTGNPAVTSAQPTSGRTFTISELLAGAKRDSDGLPFSDDSRYSLAPENETISIKKGNFPGAKTVSEIRNDNNRLNYELPHRLPVLPRNAIVDLYQDVTLCR